MPELGLQNSQWKDWSECPKSDFYTRHGMCTCPSTIIKSLKGETKLTLSKKANRACDVLLVCLEIHMCHKYHMHGKAYANITIIFMFNPVFCWPAISFALALGCCVLSQGCLVPRKWTLLQLNQLKSQKHGAPWKWLLRFLFSFWRSLFC